jgi:hypothetical protein
MYKLSYYENKGDKIPTEEYFYPFLQTALLVKNFKNSKIKEQGKGGTWKVTAVK